ncbi:MAG: type II secretion system F family protein [Chthonomonas sp.]|nr:type II secretion system F family protein [Chthonomonas sp.]
MQFRFEGVSHGSPVTGLIDAANMDDAVKQLSARGVTLRKLSAATSPAPPNVAAPTARVRQPSTPAPAIRTQEFRTLVMDSSGQVEWIDSPAQGLENLALTLGQKRLTMLGLQPKPGGKRLVGRHQMFLFFAQLSSYLRAGHGPAHALDELGRHGMMGTEATEQIIRSARMVAEGGSIATGFSARPDLFLPNVGAMLRAGEVGGFLPEACSEISKAMDGAQKIRRWGWVIWATLVNLLLIVPAAFGLRSGLMGAWGAGERGGQFMDVLSAFGKSLLWPWLPLALLLVVVLFASARVLSGFNYTLWRHRVAFRTPILGARARHESIACFAWVLSKLTEAGISPASAWWLAADSAPNLEVGRRLKVMGGRLNDGARLSEAAIDQDLLPPEFRSMLVTGEATGDVPGALRNVAATAFQRFEWMDKLSRGAVLHVGATLLLVAGGIALIVIAIVWYRELPAKVLEGLEWVRLGRAMSLLSGL